MKARHREFTILKSSNCKKPRPSRTPPFAVRFQTIDISQMSVFRTTAWPPIRVRQRLSQGRLSKLNRMAFGLAVYASTGSLPYTSQDSLLAVGQTLPDGVPTRRVTLKGFRFTYMSSSPFTKLLGANTFYFSYENMLTNDVKLDATR